MAPQNTRKKTTQIAKLPNTIPLGSNLAPNSSNFIYLSEFRNQAVIFSLDGCVFIIIIINKLNILQNNSITKSNTSPSCMQTPLLTCQAHAHAGDVPIFYFIQTGPTQPPLLIFMSQL